MAVSSRDLAQALSGVLLAWFGPEDRPVLKLAPFELPGAHEQLG